MESKFEAYRPDESVRRPPRAERHLSKSPQEKNGADIVRDQLNHLIEGVRKLRKEQKPFLQQEIQRLEDDAVVLQDGLIALRDGEMPSPQFTNEIDRMEAQAAFELEFAFDAYERLNGKKDSVKTEALRDAEARLRGLTDFRAQFAPPYRKRDRADREQVA